MQLVVTQAQSDAERLEAYELVQKTYAREFGVDLNQLRQQSTTPFRTIVLVVRDEQQTVVGTASIFYPADAHLFPSEYLFGAEIRRCVAERVISNTVEIGRLAKAGVNDRGLIVNAIMLAVDAYLRREKLAGWVATVKPLLKRMLRMTGLTMQDVRQSQPLADLDGCLDGYRNDIACFWASADDTGRAFRAFYRWLEEGVIRIDLGDPLGQPPADLGQTRTFRMTTVPRLTPESTTRLPRSVV